MRLIKFRTGWTLKFKKYHDYVNRECTLCDMHGCMSECIICNHPRADGRIAVVLELDREEPYTTGRVSACTFVSLI